MTVAFRVDASTASSEVSVVTRSPDSVKILIDHCPSGSPRKSTCVPVGSDAFGVRSHADGRSWMLCTPRYGFGTTHTLFLAFDADCGDTPSASTAARRPFNSTLPWPKPVESNAVTE